MTMEIFDYEDIQLIPNKCVIDSRSEADTTVELGGRNFKIPVVPANMATVINDDVAQWLAANGYFYIMHRFEPETRQAFIEKMHADGLYASISVGVKDNEVEFINELAASHLASGSLTTVAMLAGTTGILNLRSPSVTEVSASERLLMTHLFGINWISS